MSAARPKQGGSDEVCVRVFVCACVHVFSAVSPQGRGGVRNRSLPFCCSTSHSESSVSHLLQHQAIKQVILFIEALLFIKTRELINVTCYSPVLYAATQIWPTNKGKSSYTEEMKDVRADMAQVTYPTHRRALEKNRARNSQGSPKWAKGWQLHITFPMFIILSFWRPWRDAGCLLWVALNQLEVMMAKPTYHSSLHPSRDLNCTLLFFSH